MQSVRELKQRGFIVRPATDAIDCTEVRFNAEFHYFNPKFLEDASKLAGSLEKAVVTGDGQYKIIAAGIYTESEKFPFVLLSAAQVEEVRKAHAGVVSENGI